MKIAVDARVAGRSPYAGISNYIRQFLRTAPSFPDIEIVAFSDTPFDVPANVRSVVSPSCTTVSWDQLTLPRLLKECRADVFLNPLIKAPLFLPCPMAWIINDLNHLVSLPEYAEAESLVRRLYFGTLARCALRHRPAIGAISEYTAKLFAKEFRYPLKDISLIRLAPEFPSFSVTDVDQLRAKYRLPERFILYLGNFRRHKNVITLVKAYQRIDAEARGRVSLVLAGEKAFEYERLLAEAQSSGIASRVIFTGPVAEPDKMLLYRLADVFVLPSVSEGFGLPLLEAMSQGTVALAADAGALPEVLSDPDGVFPARDESGLAVKLRSLLNDETARKQHAEKIRRRAAEFNAEKTTGSILALCRKAAQTP